MESFWQPGQRFLHGVERFFLHRYDHESLAVRAKLRILLLVLSLVAVTLVFAGFPPLLNHPLLAVRLVVAGLFLFIPFLLWLLRRGRRGWVVGLYTLALSVVIAIPQITEAATQFDVQKTDRLVVQALVQLVVISAITERAKYLLLGIAIFLVALVLQTFVVLFPLAPGFEPQLWTSFDRSFFNIILAGGVLLIVQKAFHRSILAVEDANQTLEDRVQERTEQLQQAQRLLVDGERLAVLGRLSASIAHQINTPLAAILSSNETIRRTLPEVLGQAVALFRHLTAEQEELLIDVLDHCLARATINGLERRRMRKDLDAVLEVWGQADNAVLAEQLVDAGITELNESWRPLFVGSDALEVGQFLFDFCAVIRAGQLIGEASQKASHFILALRQSLFDQTDEQPLVRVVVDQCLLSVLTLLRGQIPPGIQVVQDWEPGLEVIGQPARLMQAWSNLILNALDAMGTSGTLTLTLRRDGAWAEFTVADTGPGIPEALRDRLFDSFVTVKPFDLGTGLGLGIARSILTDHEGTLTFDSVPGKTRFYSRLPLAPINEAAQA